MVAEQISGSVSRGRGALGSTALLLLLLIPAGLYYRLLLTAGGGLFEPVNLGLTFNSMLLHLLHGQFDVDPSTIGTEGYSHGSTVYAYFGILPALLRAPFLWLPHFAAIDFTRLGCLIAVVAAAGAKLMSVRLMWRQGDARAPSLLLMAMVAAVLMSGPQIEFLRPSIYQEVELWAGALTAMFVYLVLRGLCAEDGFSPSLLKAMAITAGLCLLTRVSNALGLYVAFGLIWLCVARRALMARQPLARLVVPFAIILAFVAAAALINFARCGNPLVFADFSHALMNDQYPDRLGRMQRYGEFNLDRIGYGLGYYFAPFWAMRDAAGNFLWSGFENGFAGCCIELPPSSFFVSDPLLIGLCAFGIVQVFGDQAERRDLVAAAGLGLLVPIVLILSAFGMTFRYRMEFYPFFELFAFLGVARLAARPAGRAPAIVLAGAVGGIVTAHAMWLLYMLSPFGPPANALGSLTVGEFYRSLIP
jgi:hypothetical protein